MRQLSLFASEPSPTASEPLVASLPAAPPPRSRIREIEGGASPVLAQRLSSLLREPVEGELTDNAETMVSYRRVEGRLRFRLHHASGRVGLRLRLQLFGLATAPRCQGADEARAAPGD